MKLRALAVVVPNYQNNFLNNKYCKLIKSMREKAVKQERCQGRLFNEGLLEIRERPLKHLSFYYLFNFFFFKIRKN